MVWVCLNLCCMNSIILTNVKCVLCGNDDNDFTFSHYAAVAVVPSVVSP